MVCPPKNTSVQDEGNDCQSNTVFMIISITSSSMARLSGLLLTLTCLGSTSASPSLHAPTPWRTISRGGDASYSGVCESVKSEILTNANKQVSCSYH